MAWDFFISYAGPDIEAAQRLHAELLTLGSTAFINTQAIQSGVWPDKLEAALGESRIVVALASQHSASAYYQKAEVLTAIELARAQPARHAVVVVPLEKDLAAPMYMKPLQPVRARPGAGMAEIAASLRALLPGIDKPLRKVEACQGAVVRAELRRNDGAAPRGIDGDEFFVREVRSFVDTVGAQCHGEFHETDCTILLPDRPGDRPINLLLRALALSLHLQKAARDAHIASLATIVHWANHVERTEVMLGGCADLHMIGSDLDAARHLLGLSDRPHILISIPAYHAMCEGPRGLSDHLPDFGEGLAEQIGLLHSAHPVLLLPAAGSRYHVERFTVHDRQKRRCELLSLTVADDAGARLGDAREPHQQVDIQFPPRPPEPNPFIEKLVAADRVWILGITHDRTHEHLAAAMREREKRSRGCWSELRIIFASQDMLERLHDQHDEQSRRNRWHVGRRSLYAFLVHLQTLHPSLRWECREYPHPLPFVGQQFMAGDETGWIRVAPMLPGQDTRSSYYCEFFVGTRAHAILAESFSHIMSRSHPLVEWMVRGDFHSHDIRLADIVERRNASRNADEGGRLRLVVLIALYTERAPRKAILQLRTTLNAGDNTDRYSNISGCVTDRDVFKARRVVPPEGYVNLCCDTTGNVNPDFLQVARLQAGQALPQREMEAIWQAAATRELSEELGIDVRPARLHAEHTDTPDHVLRRRDRYIFHVYSLAVRPDELEHIRKVRPHAQLETFDQARLMECRERLNDFLKAELSTVFLPMYRRLEVV